MGSAPRSPLVPVDAVINAPATIARVVFNAFLQPDTVLDVANWSVSWAGQDFPVTGAQSAGPRVILALGTPFGEAIIDAVSFAPPPFDVVSRQGDPAAAFVDFPLRLGP